MATALAANCHFCRSTIFAASLDNKKQFVFLQINQKRVPTKNGGSMVFCSNNPSIPPPPNIFPFFPLNELILPERKMTTVAHGPQVNYSTGEGGNGGTGGAGPSGGGEGGEMGAQRQQHSCIVCGDESDGLHFGQFTCRACAAFFRRTVSLKLQYTCKREGNCEVDKTQRNMCRSCRYRKCLQRGMLTSAVQHARDGIGKRTKSAQKISTSSSSDTPDIKMPKGLLGSPTSSIVSSTSSSTFLQPAQHSLIGIQHQGVVPGAAGGQPFVAYGGQSPSLLEQTLLQLNASTTFGQFPQHYSPSTTSESSGAAVTAVAVSPYLVGNFTNLLAQPAQSHQSTSSAGFSPHQAQPQQQPSTSSAFLQPELKYLSRMLEGYHHFLSLRKASYTLVDGFPLNQRDDEDCPQSNFGTSKKICKIEASLIMDTVEKFFTPFSQLATEDKHKMFDPFYCLFSNAERAYRTYKMFGAGDDRLLMPDGGYVRLSELQKFYENNTLVRGDPSQVAKIFENAMHYLVKTVVAHMRNIELGEMEMMALFGMFLWNDFEEISPESLQLAMRVRNEIIIDLHLFYRSQGLSEAEITLKTANLFLLIPKLERNVLLFKEDFEVAELFNMKSVRLMNDNFCISELFNMLSLSGACKRANRCALIND